MSMDFDDLIVQIIIHAAGLEVAGAGMMLVECLSDIDGRSTRAPSTRKFAIRHSQFQIALQNPAFDDGWFVDQFRCNRTSFEYILDLVSDSWLVSNNEITEKDWCQFGKELKFLAELTPVYARIRDEHAMARIRPQ